MRKSKFFVLTLLVKVLILLGACSTLDEQSSEPIGTAKKPTLEEARAYCIQQSTQSSGQPETVEQCIQRILRL